MEYQREQNNAIITYLNSQREMNSALNDLLLRYLEIERTNRRNLETYFLILLFHLLHLPVHPFPPPPFFHLITNRAPFNLLLIIIISNTPFSFSINNNSSNNSNSTNTNTTSRTQPSLKKLNSFRPRDAPISSFSRRRPPIRRAPRIRATTNVTTTTIPRDVFQNFINNTLNMGNIPQPLNANDISSNITNLTYGEIAETTNQTICPFTQEKLCK